MEDITKERMDSSQSASLNQKAYPEVKHSGWPDLKTAIVPVFPRRRIEEDHMEDITKERMNSSQLASLNQKASPEAWHLGKPELKTTIVPIFPSRTSKENHVEERMEERMEAPHNQKASPEVRHPGWPDLMTSYIGIIPQPVYLALLVIIAGFVFIDSVPTEISMVIAIMVLCGFTLGEIGKRLPILRNIGAASIIVLIAPSYLADNHLLPTTLLNVVSTFFKTTNILSLFIAIVVVGSILSMDRQVLVGGFLKVFVPVLAGTVMATIVGLLVGVAFGLGVYHTFFFIVVPIMSGGLAEGAYPLTFGYAGILHQPQPSLFAQVVPAVLVGNLTATVMAGLLNYVGKKNPRLTGEGNLEPGKHEDSKTSDSEDKSGKYVDMHHIAAVGITAVTLYLLGSLCTSLFHIPGLVIMIGIAIALKLAYMISPELQHGASHLYKFVSSSFTLPILFTVSVTQIQWKQLIEGFALPNLITGLAVVVTIMVTGFFVGRWVRLYPIEAAVINLCHSGMGGAGDLIILSAANRMKLMPFAQIATRIGGIMMVSLALLLLARFA